MLIRVTCPCGHIGLINAETLPRELVCSDCGASRRVEAGGGKAIVSTARFEEWLAGERERPRVRCKAHGAEAQTAK
jgi:hypothetical protein